MANNIESVNIIDKELSSIIDKLKESQKEILKISSLSVNLSNTFKTIKIPSKANDTLKESVSNTEQLNAVIKQQNKLERDLISTIAKKALAQESTARSLQKEREEVKILRKEQRAQLISVSNLSTSYEKLSAETNLLIREYKDLAIRKKNNVNLSVQEKTRMDQLSKSINTNQKALKDTDAEVGQFTRNVGNYSSGFDGLSVSIAQIAREAPAAAVSLNTFILGISNNIPMLQDELTKLINKNKELISQGKPTVNIFQRLAKSLVSPQVLLALVVTAFTLYNKQIIKFIQNTLKGADASRSLAKQQKIVNEAYKEGAKSASNEVAQMQVLIAFSSDVTKSTKDRNKAVDKLIKSSGGLIKEQDRLNLLNGEAVRIENKLVKAILNRAIVQQLQTKISEDVNKLLDLQLKIRVNQLKINELDAQSEQERIEYLETSNFLEQERIKISKDTTLTQEEKIKKWNELEKAIRQNNFNLNKYKSLSSVVGSLEGENSLLLKQKSTIQGDINKLIKESLRLTNGFTLELDDNTSSVEKSNKGLRNQAKTLENYYDGVLRVFEAFKLDSPNFDKIEAPEIETKKTEEALQRFNDLVAKDIVNSLDKDILSEAFSDLSGTIEQFTGANSQVFNDFFKGIQDGFEDIPDIATSSLDVIREVTNAFYNSSIDSINAQLDANNEYYDKIISNEELSDEVRKKAEKDREDREKKLLQKRRKEQKKQAEINKALAITDILINTAVGIVKALSTANVPLAITVGAIGAAQLAIAATTPIPQFKDGHLQGTYEGTAMINDAKGNNYVELIERKDGNLEAYKQRNQLIHMNKGDKVHKASSNKAKEYLSSVSDSDLINNLNNHTMMASLQGNINSLLKLERKQTVSEYKTQTDRLINAFKKHKTPIILNNNNSIGDDLDFLSKLNF